MTAPGPHEALPSPIPSREAASAGSAPRWGSARKVLGLLASIAVSTTVLVLLWHWRGIGLDRLQGEWRRADKALLVLVVIGAAASYLLLGAHKQALVLRWMGVDVGFGEMLRVRLGSGPLKLVLPLGAGDYVQIAYFWGHRRMPLGEASGALVLDKGLNLLGATFWLALGFAILPDTLAGGEGVLRQPLQRWSPLGAVLVIYGVVFFAPRLLVRAVTVARRIHRRLGDLAEGLTSPFVTFSVRRKLVLVAYGLVFQLRPLLVCLGLLAAYHLPHRVEHVTAFGSVAVFAGSVPVSVAGLGAREAAVVETFGRLGASVDALFSVGLFMTFAQSVFPWLLGVPWLIWFVRRLRRRDRSVSEETSWNSAAR